MVNSATEKDAPLRTIPIDSSMDIMPVQILAQKALINDQLKASEILDKNQYTDFSPIMTLGISAPLGFCSVT